MSHVINIDCQIKDLDALEIAAGRLGLTLNRGQKAYKWYGSWVGDYDLPRGIVTPSQLGKCQHALSVNGNPNAYEIGLLQQSDGSFTMLYDFWEGGYGLEAAVGDKCGMLVNEYALAVAEKAVQGLGWMHERDGDALVVYHPSGGSIRVTADQVDAIGFSGEACLEPTRVIAEALGLATSSTTKPEIANISIESVIPE